jgi:hypothetical protein
VGIGDRAWVVDYLCCSLSARALRHG